jgi:hypothetical protein
MWMEDSTQLYGLDNLHPLCPDHRPKVSKTTYLAAWAAFFEDFLLRRMQKSSLD